MFRNALFSALVVMIASSAMAAGAAKDAPRDPRAHERNGARPTENRADATNSAVRGAEVIEGIVARASGDLRPTADRMQEISKNKQAFGLTGDSSVGFDRFVLRVAELEKSLGTDKAIEKALSELNDGKVSKEDFLEKCKPL